MAVRVRIYLRENNPEPVISINGFCCIVGENIFLYYQKECIEDMPRGIAGNYASITSSPNFAINIITKADIKRRILGLLIGFDKSHSWELYVPHNKTNTLKTNLQNLIGRDYGSIYHECFIAYEKAKHRISQLLDKYEAEAE